MKILHLEAGRHFYGGARQVGYLIEGLAARGVENLLVCHRGNPLKETAAADVFEWRLGGDLDVSLQRRLVRLAGETRADLIHVHSRRGADLFGGRAARTAGLPAILTRRVESAEPGVWLRFKCRPYRAVVAISPAVRAELARLGVEVERLRLIPSAVDSTLFAPDAEARSRLVERYSLPADALIAGAAGQFIARKRHEFLLPLAVRLIEAEPRYRLLLFGRGPGRKRVEREAARLGLGSHVVFAGYTPDWPGLVPGLDVLLHPAQREGLGSVVLEAMSAGVPVVASAAGGIVDAIEDGIDGRLLSAEAADEWLGTVRDLLTDAALRERLGAAARRKVESRFTIEHMTESYVGLYREVVAGAAG